MAWLRGMATGSTPKLQQTHHLFLRGPGIAWKGHPTLQVERVSTSVLMEDPKVGAVASTFCCVMAPGSVSLAEKPKQKCVMVFLD